MATGRLSARMNDSRGTLWVIERDSRLRTTIMAIALLDRSYACTSPTC